MTKRVLLCVAVLGATTLGVSACSKGKTNSSEESGEPTATALNDSGDAPVTAPTPPEPPASPGTPDTTGTQAPAAPGQVAAATVAWRDKERSRAQVHAMLDAWLAAQTAGDFAAYSALYASGFTGVRRSGEKTVELDRDGWLRERKRMFGKKMTVQAEHRVIHIAGAGARVEFLQTWASGCYKDRGPKSMEVAFGPNGARITREELLSSTILMSERAALGALFADDPDAAADAELQCMPIDEGKTLWACVVTTDRSGASLDCEVALLSRKTGKWKVLDRHPSDVSAESAGPADPGDIEESASVLIRGLVQIGPKQRALEVSFEAESALQIEASVNHGTKITRLFWVNPENGTLAQVLEVQSTTSGSVDDDESSTEEYEITRTVHGGFYDIRITSKTERHAWPVDEHEESSESEILQWNDGYN